VATPLARLGRGGAVVRLAEQVSAEAAVALARGGSRLEVPIRISGRPLAGLAWPVSFEQPADLVLEGPAPSGPGPDLAVAVERLDPGHLLYSVIGAGRTLQAIVERIDAGSFRVVSRGGRGAAGAPGS